MVKILNASYENEIHIVNSPFNENALISGEGPNFGEGRPENLGKMAKNREAYCYAN